MGKPGGTKMLRLGAARQAALPLARWFSARSEGTLAELAASSILNEIQQNWRSSDRIFVGRGQFYADEEMDRFGIVRIGEDGTVEHLKDGPLPAEDGLEALCQAVQDAGGDVPHVGELDFQASGPWRHGYFHAPAFGIFSRDGVLCSVENTRLVMPEASLAAADVTGVGVRLSEDKQECMLGVEMEEGEKHTICTLPLRLSEDGVDEGEDLQMHELALLVWETEWMIKASAQLTLALRNSGGGNVRFGVAEELHAKHNTFAQIRNEMLTSGTPEATH